MKRSPKVFGVGLNKTGTTSLKLCFQTLGITPCSQTRLTGRTGLVERLLENRDWEPVLRYATAFRAFEDRPWNMWDAYRRLDERFPGSLFILTERDPESWWRSVQHWTTAVKRNASEVYCRHLEVPQLDRQDCIAAFLRYNQKVREYFEGRRNLLVMNMEAGDGWELICSFLGEPTPDQPFPHANRQTYTAADARRYGSAIRVPAGLRETARRWIGDREECPECGQRRAARAGARTSPLNRVVPRWLLNLYRGLQHRVHLRRESSPQRSRRRIDSLRALHPDLSLEKLAVVSCYFNPCAYASRRTNFERFHRGIERSGVKVLTVELAHGKTPFQLDSSCGEVIQLRADDLMWQKERLLNIGIRELLGRGFDKIVWLDADIEFEDAEHWPWSVAAELEQAAVCQVFDQVSVETDVGQPAIPGMGAVRYYRETGHLLDQNRLPPRPRSPFGRNTGFSGFGWAARAEVLADLPLYDASVAGGADKLIFAACFDDQSHEARKLTQSPYQPCPRCGHLSRSDAYTQHYLTWARRWASIVDGRVGFAPLTIRTFFHGPIKRRNYNLRREIMLKHGFDPEHDITLGPNGTWMWASDKPDLHAEVHNYFFERQEDA